MKQFHYRRGVVWRTRLSFVLSLLFVFLQSCILQHYYFQNQLVNAVGIDEPYLNKLVADRKVETIKKRVLFMGDTMLARGVGEAIEAGDDPYKYVRGILDAHDLRIANIETTIADPSFTLAAQKPYTFNAPLKSLELLKNVGIDVAVIANNHTGDFGHDAMINMLDQYRQAQIKTAGLAQTIDDAFKATITTIDGLSIATIAVNDVELAHTKVTDTLPGTAYLDKDRLSKSLQNARAAGADFVVVIPHWGTEYSLQQNDYQRQWGQFMIDAGADVVIGGHPHVTQPTETYKNGSIVYSLGNFIFDGMEGDALKGQMISIEIEKTISRNESKTTLKSLQSVGILIDAQGFPHPL